MMLKVPPGALAIIHKLKSAGYPAMLAGGAVRDLLMGRKPSDFDIVTEARPETVERIFSETYSIGKQFGVIIVHINNEDYHVSTFRAEAEYKDARRPSKVFWSDAQADAQRRDFTVNGLFYDPLEERLVDFVGGEFDLKKRLVRFIGDPVERIKEDHLRILRAVRFKVSLDFDYEPRTLVAIKRSVKLIKDVSAERIREELNKIFDSPNRAEGLVDLSEADLLAVLLPEIERLKGIPQPDQFHKEGDVFVHTVYSLKTLPADAPTYLVWATMLHDAGKYNTLTFPTKPGDRIRFNKHVKYSAGIASRVMRRLKFANFERELIVWLVKNHMILGDIPKMRISKQRMWLVDSRFPALLSLHKADAQGSRPTDLSIYKQDLALYHELKKQLAREKRRKKIKPLFSGDDLITEFGIPQGPKIGKVLAKLHELQLENKVKTLNQARVWVRNLLEKQK